MFLWTRLMLLRWILQKNFEVENSPELYISKMQSLGTSHPNKWKGTTYFPISGSMLRFYDKGKESRRGASVAISEKAALCRRGKERTCCVMK